MQCSAKFCTEQTPGTLFCEKHWLEICVGLRQPSPPTQSEWILEQLGNWIARGSAYSEFCSATKPNERTIFNFLAWFGQRIQLEPLPR